MSAVRKDYHYQDKQHRVGRRSCLGCAVVATRQLLNFREAMIIPSHESQVLRICSIKMVTLTRILVLTTTTATHASWTQRAGSVKTSEPPSEAPSELRALVMQDACIVPDTCSPRKVIWWSCLKALLCPPYLRLAPPCPSHKSGVRRRTHLSVALISERSIQHDCFRRNHVRNTLSSHYQSLQSRTTCTELCQHRGTTSSESECGGKMWLNVRGGAERLQTQSYCRFRAVVSSHQIPSTEVSSHP